MRIRYFVKPAILIYLFDLQVHSETNKRCLVFATSSFDLNITFPSMLSIFELNLHSGDF
jgi:hypothetical protein